MYLHAAIVSAALVVTPLTVEDTEVQELPPEIRAACDAEGGCTLFTALALKRRMADVYNHAFKVGLATCRNSI